MTTALIACRTLEDELRFAMARTGSDFPVAWLESGLHNTPNKLRARLQEELDARGEERVLLAMGFCGNALAGVNTGAHELIVPRVDDCISLLLGSPLRRQAVSRELAAYFLTDGWLRGERNLWVEYQYCVEKYGKETADEINEMMYGHYRTLAVLDCGVKPAEPVMERAGKIADTLHLKLRRLDATVEYLCALLTGPWEEERFLRLPPGTAAAEEMLSLPGGGAALQ